MSIVGVQMAQATDARCRQLAAWEDQARAIAAGDDTNGVLIIGSERKVAELARALADECKAQREVFEDRC